MSEYKQIKTITAGDSLWASAWGSTGNIFALGSINEEVQVWDIQRNDHEDPAKNRVENINENSPLFKLTGHALGVLSLDIDPSETYLAVNSMDNIIRIWNLETGSFESEMHPGTLQSWKIKWTKDGKSVITGGDSGDLKFIPFRDNDDGAVSANIHTTKGKYILSVDHSSQAGLIACGNSEGAVFIIDVAKEKCIKKFENHGMAVRDVAFSKDGNMLITVSDDGHIAVIDTKQLSRVQTLTGHSSWITSVEITSSGTEFFTGSMDKTIRLWDLRAQKTLQTIQAHQDTVWDLKLSPDDNYLLTASEDSTGNIYAKA